MGKYDALNDIGAKVQKFADAMDGTLAGLDADHPDRAVLAKIAEAWHKQRAAVGAALTDVSAHFKNQVAQMKESFEQVKKDAAEHIQKMEDAVKQGQDMEAAKKAAAEAAKKAAEAPPEPPHLPKIDHALGSTLAHEVLAKFGGPAPKSPPPPPPKGKDIWEDLWDGWK